MLIGKRFLNDLQERKDQKKFVSKLFSCAYLQDDITLKLPILKTFGKSLMQSCKFKADWSSALSLTVWPDVLIAFFDIWPFTIIKIVQLHHKKFAKVGLKFSQMPNCKWLKSFKIVPKWRNFAKSGHTGHCSAMLIIVGELPRTGKNQSLHNYE